MDSPLNPTAIKLEGPWLCAFAVWIPFPIDSKSNFRSFQKRGSRWSRYASFESALNTLVFLARPPEWVLAASSVKVIDRPMCVCAVGAYTTLDSSNLSKSVCDAVQGVLYPNDTDVASVTGQVFKRRSKDRSGWVAAAQLTPGTGLLEVAQAQAALGVALAELALSSCSE